MRLWDAGTHMTKHEWRTACERVQNRLESLAEPKRGKARRETERRGSRR
jgi:hypothetical protein